MIQRVQSVYLFFAAILMLATLLFPVMGFRPDESSFRTLGLFSLGDSSFLPDFVAPALSLFAGIMALITIFLYKKRKLQIKFCYWILVSIVLLYISVFYLYTVLVSEMSAGTTFFPKVAIAFPLIALILDYMAIAGIKEDQKLVSSLDRLR